MSRTRNISCLLLTLSVIGSQAGAAPQQMVFFKQSFRFGASGHRIAVACVDLSLRAPSPSDRYMNFSGDAWITRYENDKALPRVKLQEAIVKYNLQIAGDRSHSTLNLDICPQKQEPGVEYGVDIDHGLGATNDELLRQAEARSSDILKLLQPIEGLREQLGALSPALLRATEERIQQSIWLLSPRSSVADNNNVDAVVQKLAALQRDIEERAADSVTRQFLARIELTEKSALQLPNPLVEVASDYVKRIAGKYFYGNNEVRTAATADLTQLELKVKRLAGDSAAKEFAARLDRAEKASAKLPRIFSEAAMGRVKQVANLEFSGPGGSSAFTEAGLLRLEADLKRLADDTAARQIVDRAERAERAVARLLAPLADEATRRLEQIATIYFNRSGKSFATTEAELARLESDVKRLADSPDTKEFLGRYEHIRSLAAKLPAGLFDEATLRLENAVHIRLWGSDDVRPRAEADFARAEANIKWLSEDPGAREFLTRVGRVQKASSQLPDVLIEDTVKKIDALGYDAVFGDDSDRAKALTSLSNLEANIKWLTESPDAKAFFADVEKARTRSDEISDEPWATRIDLDTGYDTLLLEYGVSETRQAAAQALRSLTKQIDRAITRYKFFQDPVLAKPSLREGKVFLELKNGSSEIAGHPSHAGKPLLVDISGLDAKRAKEVVTILRGIQANSDNYEFCFKLAANGEARFRQLPTWGKTRLIGDKGEIDKLPEDIAATIRDWLQELAHDGNGDRTSTLFPSSLIELIIDHFDDNGATVKRIEEHIRRGDFRGKHIVFLVCNVENFEQFHRLSKLVLENGGGLSVCFPLDVLQARVAPLVAEAMLASRTNPCLSPAEHGAQACRQVRDRLERCLEETDDARLSDALRRAFPDTIGDPVELFEYKGELRRDLIRDQINKLRRQEKSFLQMTLRAPAIAESQVACCEYDSSQLIGDGDHRILTQSQCAARIPEANTFLPGHEPRLWLAS